MAERNRALIEEYQELLRLHGVDHLVRPELTAEDEAVLLRQIREEADRAASAYGESNLLENELREAEARHSLGPLRDGNADAASLIEDALADLGFELPGPVHVDEYPHHSFNAQACRMRHGTLLLINSGLKMLIYDVALALNTSIVFASRTDANTVHLQDRSAAMVEREAKARDTLARALANYVLHTRLSAATKQEVDLTSRGLLSSLMGHSGVIFAVAHEYGHLLAGHLDQPRSSTKHPEWIRKSHDQEFEADQIGALLALRVHNRTISANPTLAANLAAVGPFLFLAIDHLLNRVRAEVHELSGAIVSDHPPSAIRAAALRTLLSETAGLDSFQVADATVQILAARENEIINQLRGLTRERSSRALGEQNPGS